MQLAVFASGGGSNFQQIIDAVEDERLPAQLRVCVSDRGDAGALDRAARHDIPARVIAPGDESSVGAYAQELGETLHEFDVDFVALAGYLRKIPPSVVRAFRHRIVNIHPALLPAFGGKGMYGMNVHRAVVEYGVRWTGVTVHLVEEEYDQGAVVLQQPVRVYPDDTPRQVAERVLAVEHRLYPEALRLFATGRISVDQRTVRISGDYALHGTLSEAPGEPPQVGGS